MKANLLIKLRLSKPALFFLLILAIAATACKTKKSLASPIDNSKVDKDNKKEVFKAIAGNRFEFEYFSADAVCNYSGSPVPANVTLRMQRDEKIWMAASAVFFDVARVLITKDSIHIIMHQPEKYVMSRPISHLENVLGAKLTLSQLQDVLVGNSILNHGDSSSYENRGPRFNIMQFFNRFMVSEEFSSASFRPDTVKADEVQGPSQLEVIYSDFTPVNARLVPQMVNISAVTNRESLTAELKYSDISTEVISEWPFRPPPNYERR